MYKVKKIIGKFLKTPLEFIASNEAMLSRAWSKQAHKRLRFTQWALGENPEWMDHNIDHHYQWPDTGFSFWLERGVFSTLSLKNQGRGLELCCGDGFNSANFYSNKIGSLISCDFDESAIKHANKHWKKPNIKFVLADIRTQMPKGIFDNVIWDASIQHFTEEEVANLMLDIKSRLATKGVLSGSTIVENETGEKQLPQHEYEFKSKEDLLHFLSPHFEKVVVFETIYPTRHNLYYWASDDKEKIPFQDGWQSMCCK